MKVSVSLLFLTILLLTSCGPSEEFVQLQGDYAGLLTDLSHAESELDSLQSEMDGAIDTLQNEKDALQSELDSFAQENFQYSRAMESLICEDQIENMSYDAILESTSRLEAYVNGLDGVQYTSGGFRDTIYNNADSKIHAIRYNSEDGEQYIMTFLVFYDEFNWLPSTFFVDRQCWIDPPVRIPSSGGTTSQN